MDRRLSLDELRLPVGRPATNPVDFSPRSWLVSRPITLIALASQEINNEQSRSGDRL